MAAKSRYFDDMHPRSFPKDKQLGKVRMLFTLRSDIKIFFSSLIFIHYTPQITALVPKPTLPGVSIIVDKNNLTKAAPKKSFLKWKQQHEALFEPKQFLTRAHSVATLNNKRKVVPLQDIPEVNTKFDLDFHKAAPPQQRNQEEYQQIEHDYTKFRNNVPANATIPEFQSMMTFSQLNRMARSEATRYNVSLEGQRNSIQSEDCQSNPCGCQCVAVVPSPENQNNELENNKGSQSDLRMAKEIDLKPKIPLTKDALATIVKEQIEIVQQQKHILMQQNEIFNLQYQIEKLLIMNNGLKNASSNKQLQSSPIRKSIKASPSVKIIETGTQSIINCQNSSPQTRKSIGIMTSFQGNLNDAWSPKCNQNYQSDKGSDKDTMLERINKIIQNSPPMINYRMNNGNCRISPKRGDINISSQT